MNTTIKYYKKHNEVGFKGWVEHKTMGTLIGFVRLDGSLLRVEDIKC